MPSGGTGLRRANGLAPNSIRPVKNAPSPINTAVAQGAISRCLPRVAKSTAEEVSDSTHAHSSSDPSWLDHIAVSLQKPGVVVDEWSATTLSDRSVRANAASITTTQIVSRTANAYTARRAESA